MNTFLPYPCFQKSAEALDNKRLGKQRVEVLQLVNGSWKHHPAALMWQPYRDALIEYGMVVCKVWQARGFRDTVWTSLYMLRESREVVYPTWLGSHKLHSSHRANLLRKDEAFYRKYGWTETPIEGYFWPNPLYRIRGNDHDERSCSCHTVS